MAEAHEESAATVKVELTVAETRRVLDLQNLASVFGDESDTAEAERAMEKLRSALREQHGITHGTEPDA